MKLIANINYVQVQHHTTKFKLVCVDEPRTLMPVHGTGMQFFEVCSDGLADMQVLVLQCDGTLSEPSLQGATMYLRYVALGPLFESQAFCIESYYQTLLALLSTCLCS